MSKLITQVNYDELQRLSKDLCNESEEIARLHAVTRQKVEALHGSGWIGLAANAFFREQEDVLLPAVLRASKALSNSETALNQIMNIIHAADEETATYFRGIGKENITSVRPSTTSSPGIATGFTFPKWAEDAMRKIKIGGELMQDIALLAVIRNGQTFADQVRIFGPNWYSKYILGFPEQLRNIKGATLINNMAVDSLKVTPWSVFFTGVKLAADIIPDMFKYTDVAHRGAAIAADSLITAASLGASYYGMGIGATIGTAICPGIGTVIGGMAGGFLSGWATDHILTTPFANLIPEAGGFVGAVVGNTILPVNGIMAGWQLGGEGGKVITGLISPDVTKLSIKDVFIEGTANLINGVGEFIGNQIYPNPIPQGI